MRRQIINRRSPRVRLTMEWGSSRPLGLIGLYMRRVGDPEEFAVYTPIQEDGAELLFQFDELLFVRPQGRYVGRLLVGATYYASIQIEYRDAVHVLAVENADHV